MWHLQAAEAALRELNIYEPDPAIYNSVLSKVRIASLDCYIREVSHNLCNVPLKQLLRSYCMLDSPLWRHLILLHFSCY